QGARDRPRRRRGGRDRRGRAGRGEHALRAHRAPLRGGARGHPRQRRRAQRSPRAPRRPAPPRRHAPLRRRRRPPHAARAVRSRVQGSCVAAWSLAESRAGVGVGSVVTVWSMASTQALSGVLGYSVAKAGIDNFTRWLAVEMAGKHGAGIRVNAIAPGFFVSEQNRAVLMTPDGGYTDRARAIIGRTPMGRFGRPEGLIGAGRWPGRDAASFVTGAIIPIDGGFSSFSGV